MSKAAGIIVIICLTITCVFMALTCIIEADTERTWDEIERIYEEIAITIPKDEYAEGAGDVEQKRIRSWGSFPKQNFCPHCGEFSATRFCTNCKKERGNLPFIGVYCPKCQFGGKHTYITEDLYEICGNCGSEKTWKYRYEDWQVDPSKGIIINPPEAETETE